MKSFSKSIEEHIFSPVHFHNYRLYSKVFRRIIRFLDIETPVSKIIAACF